VSGMTAVSEYEPVLELYERGLYVQAYERIRAWGPMAELTDPARQVIAGRIAHQVGNNRLGSVLHLRAAKAAPRDLEAAYYGAYSTFQRRGPWFAWQLLQREAEAFDGGAVTQADWLALRAQVAATLRDFEASDEAMDRALAMDTQHPWLDVAHGYVLEQQDKYDEAQAANERALAKRAWFRPAVQASAHLMTLRGAKEEATALLSEAAQHLECGPVHAQLAGMHYDADRFEEAWAELDRFEQRCPELDKDLRQWASARRAETAYRMGRWQEAADYADGVRHSEFYKDFARRLREHETSGDGEAKRVQLEVDFVRQHHQTCAPATLSAISRYWQMPANHLEVAEAICYDGTPAHSERHWAESHGWRAREFRVTWESAVALIDAGIPFTLTTVDPTNAHLQAIIGYDAARRTLLIRDPFESSVGEFRTDEGLTHYRSTGPRGMAMIPLASAATLDAIDLPDAALYDVYYRLQRALHEHDREGAASALAEMEAMDGEHRLTTFARLSLADYDQDTAGRLAAIEAQLEQFGDCQVLKLRHIASLGEIGRHDERQRELQRVVEETEWKKLDPVFLQLRAQDLREDYRQHRATVRLLHKALRRNPREPENYYHLAHVMWDERNFATAMALYRIATCLGEKDERYAQSYFIASRHLKQTEATLGYLRRRFDRLGAKSSLPARTLFIALDLADRVPESLEVLEEAMAKRADDGELMLHAARQFSRFNRHERAAELLERARPCCREADWLRTKATLAQHRGETAEALSLWRTIAEREPMAYDAHSGVAELLSQREGPEAAVAHLRGVAEAYPHNYALNQLYAQGLSEIEDDARALEVLEHLTQVSPNDTWCRRELVRVYGRARQLDKALDEARRAVTIEPNTPANHVFEAIVHRAAGDLEAARASAHRAIELSVDTEDAIEILMSVSDTPAQRRAALSFLREQLMTQVTLGDGLLAFRYAALATMEPQQVLAVLDEALAERPDMWQAWSSKVAQLTEMDRLDEAERLAAEAVERFPLLPKMWLDKAEVHRRQANYAAEIEALDKALQINPDWSQAVRQRSEASYRSGDFAGSRQILERALERSPRDAAYEGALAELLWKADEREAAVQHIERAIELAPGYEWAWDRLRDWAARLGRSADVTALAKQMTEKRPGSASTWFVYAQTLTDFDDLAERIAALDKAIELAPRFIDAYDQKAELLASLQQYDEALAALRLEHWGEEPPVPLLGRAAWIEAERGRLDAAIERMEQAVAIDPFYSWGWMQLADWRHAKEDEAGYLEAATELARINPNTPVALGYLGDAKRVNDQPAEAKALLRRAMELEPEYAFAGASLFDLLVHDSETDEASAVLQRVEPFLPASHSARMRTALAAARGDQAAATESLKALCRVEDAEPWQIHQALAALETAKMDAVIHPALFAVAQEADCNPAVGRMLIMELSTQRKLGNATELLEQLKGNAAVWSSAASAYIDALVEQGKPKPLLKFVDAHGHAMHGDDALWGQVSYGLITFNLFDRTVQWMRDWRDRAGVAPWMMLNYALALRYLNQVSEAQAVSREMIRVEPDHATATHRMLLTMDEAIAGRLDEAAATLRALSYERLDPFYQFIYLAVDAMVRMHSEGAGAYERARGRIAQARGMITAFRRDKLLRGAHDAAVRHVAKSRGGVMARLWSLGVRWF